MAKSDTGALGMPVPAGSQTLRISLEARRNDRKFSNFECKLFTNSKNDGKAGGSAQPVRISQSAYKTHLDIDMHGASCIRKMVAHAGGALRIHVRNAYSNDDSVLFYDDVVFRPGIDYYEALEHKLPGLLESIRTKEGDEKASKIAASGKRRAQMFLKT